MKKLLFRAVVLCVAALMFAATSPAAVECTACATIQEGTITATDGSVLATGYDQWGYNYQSHGFNGIYDNVDRAGTVFTDENCDAAPFGCVTLQMKWNDAWLSNQDCNLDGKLDRPAPYKGSGAWNTNHMSGSYEYLAENGRMKEAHWTYFVKTIAVPLDAVACGANWCEADGVSVIGPRLWGDFAIIQSVYNDPVGGATGLEYLSPVSPGLGAYK